MDKADEKYLHQLYYNPKNPTAYTSTSNLWKYLKEHNSNISRKNFEKWLTDQDVYTSHKPIRRNFKRQRVVTSGINDLWDADLMDMSNLSVDNDDIKFIAIFIDVFSRYLYAVPMKDKTPRSTRDALKEVLKELNEERPDTFRSDAGKEFIGKEMKTFLNDMEIYQQIARNDPKANYAERVIRTLKNRIYKYLYANKTKRYIDELQNFVDSYNESIHSSIGQSPESVNKENEPYVWASQYIDTDFNEEGDMSIPKNKYSDGDMVRISNIKTPFSRGYGQTYSEELFRIRDHFLTEPVTYMLEDWNGEKIHGMFYEPELSLVTGKNKDTEFRVEKILSERTVRGEKQYLIKWKGYSKKYNSWEPAGNII